MFLQAGSPAELRAYMAQYPDSRCIAGGTDIMPVQNRENDHEAVFIDISGAAALHRIVAEDGVLSVGAAATFAEIERNALLRQYAPVLCLAASQVGSPQIRNLGTIGGNVAPGSPAADTPPVLAMPDAAVRQAMEAASADGSCQCAGPFAVSGGPTVLALTWPVFTVTAGERGGLAAKLSRPELASLTPDAAAAWLLEQYGAVFGEQTRYFMAARDSGGYSLYFYRPEEDLTQGILQRSILKTWVRLSGGSCELRLYRPELSDANTVGAYPLVTVDQARQRLAAGQHLSAWEPFPGEDRVKRVDLQYLARQTDRYFMPYYVFWAECDDGEQGVCYRPYYVPAVADAYIAGMPQSPTGAA